MDKTLEEKMKLLPDEISEAIKQKAIHATGGDYEGGMKGIAKDGYISSMCDGAIIARTHSKGDWVSVEAIEKMIKSFEFLKSYGDTMSITQVLKHLNELLPTPPKEV